MGRHDFQTVIATAACLLAVLVAVLGLSVSSAPGYPAETTGPGPMGRTPPIASAEVPR